MFYSFPRLFCIRAVPKNKARIQMAAFLSVTSAVFALLDAVTFGVPFGSKAASSGFAVRAAGVVCFSLLSAPLTVTLQEAAMDASDFRKAVMVA